MKYLYLCVGRCLIFALFIEVKIIAAGHPIGRRTKPQSISALLEHRPPVLLVLYASPSKAVKDMKVIFIENEEWSV